MPSAAQPRRGPGGSDAAAALAAQAMHDMQPHPPVMAQPSTPAHGIALPKVPQASPSIQRAASEASQSLLGGPTYGIGSPEHPALPWQPGTEDQGWPHAPSAAAPAASADEQGRAALTQSAGQPAARDGSSGVAAYDPQPQLGGGAGRPTETMQHLPGESGRSPTAQGGPVAVLSQLDLTDLFHAAEQQAAARLAASHAQEQSMQRSQEAAIARAGAVTLICLPTGSQVAGLVHNHRRRGTPVLPIATAICSHGPPSIFRRMLSWCQPL